MRYTHHSKRNVFVRRQHMLEAHAADQSRRRKHRSAVIELARSRFLRDSTYAQRAGRRASKTPRYFPAPEQFNLSANAEETVKFLMQFRQWSSSTKYSRSFYVDLRPVRAISPAGALLLAAELHRWRLIYKRKMRAMDAGEWDTSVRNLLGDMGFFDLLDVDRSQLPVADQNTRERIRFLPFKCGTNADTRPFVELRDMIESYTGRLKQRLGLYQGVSEAITNVLHHAYVKQNNLSRWWMSASVNAEDSKLTVMVLDHGQGIPKTLPRTIIERIRKHLIVPKITSLSDDGEMIEAAVQLGRSSLKQANRGHGLQRDIQAAVQRFDGAARLRIYSNRGRYVFERQFDGGTSESTATIAQSLDGTFIEWTFMIPQLGFRLT